MRSGAILLLMFMSVTASAQYFDKQFFIGWTVNMPVLNKEFIDNTSARGLRLGYREMIREKLGVGVDLTATIFNDQIPRQTYVVPGGAYTTEFINYANNYAITLAADYYPVTNQRLMAYAGLGAGLANNNFKMYYNVFSRTDNTFGLILRPRAGAMLKIREKGSWCVHAAVHLEYATTKSPEMGYNSFLNPGFELGLVYLNW